MATIIVNSLADNETPGDGLTTLREALVLANTNAGADSITFSVGAGSQTITLGSELVLSSDVTIDGDTDGDGAADITVSGGGTTRVFSATGGTSTLDALTITEGDSGSGSGGGLRITAGATVNVMNSTIRESSAEFGGGIWNDGTATLINSTLNGNTGTFQGGGIYNVYGRSIELTNSTLSGNEATNYEGGGIFNSGTATLTNSTISGNSANGVYGGNGGGIHNSGGGVFDLTNSIVLGNSANVNASAEVSGAITSTTSLTGAGPETAASVFAALLGNGGRLTWNGGPVQTIALNWDVTNPALDIGLNGAGLLNDAIGNDRAVDLPEVVSTGIVDAGAVELQAIPPDLVAQNFSASTSNAGIGEEFTVSYRILNQGGLLTGDAGASIVITTASDILDTYYTGGNGEYLEFLGGASTTDIGIQGSFEDASVQVTLPGDLGPGNYYLGVIADPNTQLDGNEIDNAVAIPFTIFAPDLIVQNVSASDTTLVQGETFSLDYTILNQGNGISSSQTSTAFFLSDDSNYDAGIDTLLAAQTTTNIVGPDTFEVSSFVATLPSNIAPGTYFLAVVADFNEEQTEGDETNNTAFLQISVDELPSLIVTTASDTIDPSDGETSLREALALANSNADASTITFDIAPGSQTIILGGELVLSSDVTIDGDTDGDGAADITVSGGNTSRVFHATDGASTLAALTITNGNAGSENGGGLNIASGASVSVANSTISNSVASNGGGVYNTGTAILTNSTLTGNSGSNRGGGFYNAGIAVLTNATLNGNATYVGGGIANRGTADLINSTLSGNSGSIRGGGVYSSAVGTTTLTNSIVLGNIAGTDAEVSGVAVSNTSITSGSATDVFAATDGSGAGVLADNGGPVQTIALSNDLLNPALDAGTDSAAPATDAAGSGRVDLGLGNNGANISDLGALELEAIPDTPSLIVTVASDIIDAFDGEVSLREALSHANDSSANGGTGDADNDGDANDTITFAEGLSGQTITLGVDGELVLASNVTIVGDTDGDGAADITVSGGGTTRVFNATNGTSMLDALTITNGNAGSGNGGGLNIANGALMGVTNSTISNSAASFGAAINNLGAVTLTNSTLNGNTAANRGGGVYNIGTADLINTTLSDNSTFVGGGIANRGMLNLVNSMLSGNVGSLRGGGLYSHADATADLTNSIVLGNTGGTDAEVSGTVANTTSITSGTASSVFAAMDGSGGGLLANNGGPVHTIALKNDVLNPALDAGTAAIGVPATDAAGQGRFDFPGVTNMGANFIDLGALELQFSIFSAEVTVEMDSSSNLDLSAITLTDAIGTGVISVVLTATEGTMAATSSAGVTIAGSGSGALTLTGTATAIDSYLNDPTVIQYTSALGSSGNNVASIAITSDGGAGAFTLGAVDIDSVIQGSSVGDSLTGGSNDDTIFGGAGNDTIEGASGSDSVLGEAGDDHINGSFGADPYLSGGAGDDTILGGGGNDTLDGGDDNDRLEGGTNNDHLEGGGGNDLLLGQIGQDTLNGGLGDDSIIGGNASDQLSGGLGNDTLLGQGSSDTLTGGDNDDHLEGGASADVLNGDAGADTLEGGAFNDVLYGGAGGDLLNGGTGVDTLNGDEGNDTLIGGSRNDVLNGGADNDDLDGGIGADILNGDAGMDTLDGGSSNDTLDGGMGADVVIGGSGSDRFFVRAGEGGDTLTGDAGSDVFDFETGFGTATITDFTGQDEVDLTDVTGVTGFADLTITYGVDALVALGGGDVITLTGVTGGLDAGDFGL